MSYTIAEVLKADLQSRYDFFKDRPSYYILNMLLGLAVGFPACKWGVGLMHIQMGVDLFSSILLVVMAYWASTWFWAWRVIRLITRT